MCRFCGALLRHTFVDLGMSPLCESYVSFEQLNEMEPFYPLHVYVCEKCFLVQLQEYVSVDAIFSDYAYFSSYSDSWLQHASNYVDQMVERFRFTRDSYVIELASNDGYLLQYFVAKGIPVLGVEPAANVAQVAIKKGVPTLIKFFGIETAREMVAQREKADLILANNALAQVPDVNDFVAGMKILLAPTGIVTVEFPHLMRLIEENQFDTIYHEHFSYFSFLTSEKIFAAHGLTLFDVEELRRTAARCGSYARHVEDPSKPVTARVAELRSARNRRRIQPLAAVFTFWRKSKGDETQAAGVSHPGQARRKVLGRIRRARQRQHPAELLRYPHRLPRLHRGSQSLTNRVNSCRAPISRSCHPDKIRETRPDYILILPWNLKEEIRQQLSYVREWGGELVVPIPEVEVLS